MYKASWNDWVCKYLGSNKAMSIKVSDKKLLIKYNKTWEIIGSLINKEFDSELVYGDNDE